MKVVRNMNTLKAMQRCNFITFCNQTGEKITGLYTKEKFTCYYVEEGRYLFEYKWKKYTTEYVSGCFYPYVFEVDE